jgi:hypothetical protein
LSEGISLLVETLLVEVLLGLLPCRFAFLPLADLLPERVVAIEWTVMMLEERRVEAAEGPVAGWRHGSGAVWNQNTETLSRMPKKAIDTTSRLKTRVGGGGDAKTSKYT